MTTSSFRRNNEAQGRALMRLESQMSEPVDAVSKETDLERMTESPDWTSFEGAQVDDDDDPTSLEHNRGYMGSTAKAISAVENCR